MDGGLVIFIIVMTALVGLTWYVWKHKRGVLARGIGAAGARYNELTGQGTLPTITAPISQPPIRGDDTDTDR